MKLVYCEICHDIFNLKFKTKTCECGNVAGKYIDNKVAEIYIREGGTAYPLGISNHSFARQLKNQKEKKVHDSKWGDIFESFFVPQLASTIRLYVGGKLIKDYSNPAVRSNLSTK
jgi:hypothetical protein